MSQGDVVVRCRRGDECFGTENAVFTHRWPGQASVRASSQSLRTAHRAMTLAFAGFWPSSIPLFL
jgi:hypothetical protein